MPESRVVTGLAQGSRRCPTSPSSGKATRPRLRTSSGTLLDTPRLRLTIWDDRLDRRWTWRGEVRQRFNRADFAWSHGRVLDCRQVQHAHLEEDDGVWRVMLDYELRVSQTELAA